ncbi:MAG TPA: hypothetical protein VFO25_08465 [Candidatus Eremiobacteraceae bacterium]|nr:hypothetical protein [Candidatus Eremiobacteraceae bacterium]
MVVRFEAAKGDHAIYSLALSLAAPFFIAKRMIQRFDFSPQYSFGFGYRIGDEPEPAGMLPGPIWEDWFKGDVHGVFADAAADRVLRCLRGGNHGPGLTRDEVRRTLDDYWAEYFRGE